MIGGEGDLWAHLAKYATPACFLGIEVKISKSREAERFSFGSDDAGTRAAK